MAIDIDGGAKIGRLIIPSLLLIFSFLVSAGLIASYFYFSNSYDEASKVYAEKSTALLKTPEEIALEGKLSSTNLKITKFTELFDNHKKIINSLKFLEDFCHPEVWYSSFSYDSSTGDLTLSGFAPSLKAVTQQIIILKNKSEFLTKIQLASLSAPDEKGKVAFSLNLSLVPEIIKK